MSSKRRDTNTIKTQLQRLLNKQFLSHRRLTTGKHPQRGSCCIRSSNDITKHHWALILAKSPSLSRSIRVRANSEGKTKLDCRKSPSSYRCLASGARHPTPRTSFWPSDGAKSRHPAPMESAWSPPDLTWLASHWASQSQNKERNKSRSSSNEWQISNPLTRRLTTQDLLFFK